jgi:DNA-binding transcriptional regulator YiaG
MLQSLVLLEGMFCATAQDLLREESVKPGLPPVIVSLIKWRKRKGLSQPAAAEALRRSGLQVSLSTLQKWEIGIHQPGPLATRALKQFLEHQR